MILAIIERGLPIINKEADNRCLTVVGIVVIVVEIVVIVVEIVVIIVTDILKISHS